jgi:GT2 family glycosyltransferase
LHRDLLARVGPFDEPYFLYWEDVDYSYRCLQAGGRLAVRTDLAVMHAGGGTQEARRGTAKPRRYYRYNCRNRLLFAARHLGGRQLLHWILRSPQAGWHVVLQGGRRQLLRSPMPLLAALHGSVEGLGWAVGALLTNRRDGPPSEGWWTPAVVRAPRTEDAA